MIGAFIYSVLKDNPNLKRELGDQYRIYPMVIPQGVDLPAVLYQTISKSPVDTTDGPALLDEDVIQVTCYSFNYQQANQVMAIIRAKLDRYSGASGGVTVQSIRFLTGRDSFDEKGRVMGMSHDYQVRWRRDYDQAHSVDDYHSDEYEIGKT